MQRSHQIRVSRQALLVFVGTATIVLTVAGGAFAQSSDVEEMIVTATKRRQSIADIPVAIRAVSGEDLAKRGVSELVDISKVDPSVTVDSYGAASQKFVIRGVTPLNGATTGIYLDEAPLQGGFNDDVFGDGSPSLRLLDLERVEVLKGPQGTLFGAGSMSGTLRVVTKKPQFDGFGGYFDVSGAHVEGGHPFYTGNAAVNVPVLKDKLAIRMVIWGESGGGYIDDTIRASGLKLYNANDQHVFGYRISALIKPTENLSITAAVNHQQVDVGGSQAWKLAEGPYHNTTPSQEPYHDLYTLYSLNADYDAGFGDFVVAAAYGDKHTVQPYDSTPTGAAFGFPTTTLYIPDMRVNDTTVEARFSSKLSGPLQFVVGGYYEHFYQNFKSTAVTEDPATGLPFCTTTVACETNGYWFAAPPFSFASAVEFATNDRETVNQYAVYGQADYKILPRVTGTVGIRYYYADIKEDSLNLQDIYPDYVFGVKTTPYYVANVKGYEHKPSYNMALLWKPTDTISLYGRAASGFRIGGLNLSQQISAQQGVIIPAAFDPDNLWNYEVGAKTSFFGGKVTFNGTLFLIDWEGQQITATAANAFGYTLNAGKTVTKGFEISGTVQPMPGLTLAGAATYTDAHLDEDLPPDAFAAGTPGFKGDTLPLSAKWAFGLQSDYEFSISEELKAYFLASLTYHDKSASAFNTLDTFYTELPSYFLLDVTAGTIYHGWNASVFVRNLTNEKAVLGVNADLDGTRVFSARPRTIGMRMMKDF